MDCQDQREVKARRVCLDFQVKRVLLDNPGLGAFQVLKATLDHPDRPESQVKKDPLVRRETQDYQEHK